MKSVLLLGVMLSAVYPAHAQFHIGASMASPSGTFQPEDDGARYQSQGSAWKAYGGYRFTRFLAAELSYLDFGRYEFSSISARGDVEVTAVDASICAHHPIGPCEVFVRAGLARLRWEGEIPLRPFGNPEFTGGSSGLIYGAGVELKVMEHFYARGEWESVAAAGGIDGFSFGVGCRF